jgi:hypothetical protein
MVYLIKIKVEIVMQFTLITGATGFLGKAFCAECASRGENLILTGRSEDKLALLKRQLLGVTDKVRVVCFACDLTDSSQRKKFFEFIENLQLSFGENATISRLINVAGADIQKPFESYTEDKLTFQARVCFEAAVSMCNFAIKHRSDKLNIINISSVSGIYPMPYFALYSASKGALTNFSVALNREMKGSGVKVTAVLPGAIYTREDVVAYIKTQGLWGKIAAKEPEYVAAKALSASDKGKAKVVVGGANKFMNVATKLLPLKLKMHFIAKKWSKTTKDAF